MLVTTYDNDCSGWSLCHLVSTNYWSYRHPKISVKSVRNHWNAQENWCPQWVSLYCLMDDLSLCHILRYQSPSPAHRRAHALHSSWRSYRRQTVVSKRIPFELYGSSHGQEHGRLQLDCLLGGLRGTCQQQNKLQSRVNLVRLFHRIAN